MLSQQSPTAFSLSLLHQFAPFLCRLGSANFRRRLVEWTPSSAVQKVKYISDVMHNTAVGILHQKQQALAEDGDPDSSASKDIITMLRRSTEFSTYLGKSDAERTSTCQRESRGWGEDERAGVDGTNDVRLFIFPVNYLGTTESLQCLDIRCSRYDIFVYVSHPLSACKAP